MKYFSPSYWFKLWLLSAPLFNDETIGINAKSINNEKIKNWARNNTNLQSINSINQGMNYTKLNTNYQPYNLSHQVTNQTIDPFYQTYLDSISNQELETSTHKHRHEKSRKRHKRQHTEKNQSTSTEFTTTANNNEVTTETGMISSTEFTTINTSTESKNITLFNLNWKTNILQLKNKLIIDMSNRRQYITTTNLFLDELISEGVLRTVFNPSSVPGPGDQRIFTLNIENYGYFRLPVEVRGTNPDTQQSFTRNLELVFRTDNLYLEGFITNTYVPKTSDMQNYYYFNPNLEPWKYRRNYEPVGTPIPSGETEPATGRNAPHLQQIPNINGQNIQLDNIGSNYKYLIPETKEFFNWYGIYKSFLQLTNDFDPHKEPSLGSLANSLGKIIFVTSESLRFRKIYYNIYTNIIFNDETIQIQRNAKTNSFYEILVKWGSLSKNTIAYTSRFLEELQILKDFQEWVDTISSYRNREERQNQLTDVLENTPIEDLTYLLFTNEIRVILGGIFLNRYFCRQVEEIQKKSTNTKIKYPNEMINSRDTNTYWNEQICDLKPQIDKIQGEIKSIKIVNEQIDDYNWIAKNIYVASTNNEVYIIKKKGDVRKFSGINFPIKDIQLDKEKNGYVISDQCEIYNLNSDNLNAEKIMYAKSCDLNEEIIFYYNTKHENEVSDCWFNGWSKCSKIAEFHFNKINPVANYEKISFIGEGQWTMGYWGNTPYTGTIIGSVVGRELDSFIKNEKASNTMDDVNRLADIWLQSVNDKSFLAGVSLQQRFGLTFYWENGNYYLQVLIYQYGEHWLGDGGRLSINFGNGIRLYNDDNKPNNDNYNKNKSIIFYYEENKKDKIISFFPTNSVTSKREVYNLNLGKINPVANYEKLQFIGDYFSDGWGVRIKWGSWIYDSEEHKAQKTSDIYTSMTDRSNNFHNIISNVKVTDDTSMDLIKFIEVQNLEDKDVFAWVGGSQKFGLTWYWEKENYYLQLIVFQYLDWRASEASLECSMKIGNGIILYNDNNYSLTNQITRSKINIVFDYVKNYELENSIKWNNTNSNYIGIIQNQNLTDPTTNLSSESTTESKLTNKINYEDTKSWDKNISDIINQEQHLPLINNQNSYANNNVTLGV